MSCDPGFAMRFCGLLVAVPVVLDQLAGLFQRQLRTRQGRAEEAYRHIKRQIRNVVLNITTRLHNIRGY